MIRPSLPFGLLALPLIVLVSSIVSAQEQPATDLKAQETALYANAHPYVDEPLPELKKSVHELAKLRLASDDAAVPDLLHKVGAKADELLRQIPDLISDENVQASQFAVQQGAIPGCVGSACTLPGSNVVIDQRFSYLILTDRAQGQRMRLQEYRTGSNGKPIRQGVETPYFQGFVEAWVAFSSPNQVESRFRYLGEEKIDGHETFAVGFAQIPGSVESPGVILGEGEMLLQGIAWIDRGDFRILRMRTDLLAPLPEIRMDRQTSNMVFGAVRLAGMDTDLWLPISVHLEMEARGQLFREQHKYSNFRLYRSKTRILFPEN